MCERQRVCERERERVCVCVCEREREKECECVRERGIDPLKDALVCVSVCVCV